MAKIALLAAATLSLAAVLLGIESLMEGAVAPMQELAADFLEKSILVGVMVAVAVLVVRLQAVERGAGALRADLDHARLEGATWRARSRQLMESLASAISAQFDAWGLTPAEAEIAGLMLKGLSLKEIAVLRQTSETTIRQQAQGIYRKSGLANRAQFAAYFLEDLYDVAEAGRSRDMAAPPNLN